MRDELPDWLDASDDEPARPVRRARWWVLLAVAGLLWLAVTIVVLTELRTTDADHPDVAASAAAGSAAAPEEDTADGQDTPPGGAADAGPDDDGLALTEVRGGWRLATEDGDVAAVAAVVARAWLTGVEPTLSLDGVDPPDDGAYVEHLVVETVERPGAGAAVATLLAVVLDRDGEDLTVRVRRLAVPVVTGGDGPRPAGPPWWLPGPDLTPAPPVDDTVDDPQLQLAAADALAAAGFDDVALHGLSQTGLWPVVADVSATTPEGERVDGEVWLRRHVDGLVVVGTAPPRAASPREENGP